MKIHAYPELEHLNREFFDFSAFAIRALRHFIEDLKHGETPIFTARAKGAWERSRDRHFHLFPELFFQLQGGCRFEFPHQKLDLLPGQLLLVPPGVPHGEFPFVHCGRNFTNLVLMAADDTPEFHLAVPNPHSGKHAPESSFGRRLEAISGFQSLADSLGAAIELRSDEGREAQRHLVIGLLLKLTAALAVPPPPLPFAVDRHPKIQMAEHYIRSQFPGRIPDVRATAAAIGCSPNYLSMLFRRETGMRLTEYINRIRLEYARRMLRGGRHKIAEIAWSCGFQDASYFAELYRVGYGRLPSEEGAGGARTPVPPY